MPTTHSFARTKRIADACLYLAVVIMLAFAVIFIAGEAKAEQDIQYASVVPLGATKEEVTSEMHTRGAVLTTEEGKIQLWDHKEYCVTIIYSDNRVAKVVSFLYKKYLPTNEYENLIDKYVKDNGNPYVYSHKDVYVVWTGNNGEFAMTVAGKYLILIATYLFDAENTVFNVREFIHSEYR